MKKIKLLSFTVSNTSVNPDSLVSSWELEVNADPAVLAAVGRAAPWTGSHNVFVKGDVKDGASGIDIDVGMASRTARANGGDVDNLDILGSRRGGGNHGRADCAGAEEAREEPHFGGWLLQK